MQMDTNSPVRARLLEGLEELTPEVRWHTGERTVEDALFSRFGFTEELQTQGQKRTDVHLIGLQELDTMIKECK